MLEFNFQSIDQRQRTGFAKLACGLPANRASVEFLVKEIGVRITVTRNDPYFAEAFNYLCGHLFAYANMPSEAAQAIAASNVLPYSGGDALFHDAVAESIAFAHAQEDAIGRGVPAVILASMPRAVSAALTQTLAQMTSAPVVRASIGEFPNCWLMPSWLRRLARGGAILAAKKPNGHKMTGGRGEIRTHERLAPLPVFKTGALNHSATLPVFLGTFHSGIVPKYQRDTSAACVRDR